MKYRKLNLVMMNKLYLVLIIQLIMRKIRKITLYGILPRGKN